MQSSRAAGLDSTGTAPRERAAGHAGHNQPQD